MKQNYPKFVLVGSVGAGKTTLFNALLGIDELARKTQSVEYSEQIVDTPGEFFNHPRLYHALITTMVDIDTIVYVHAANDFEYKLPQGLLEINQDKRIFGVITQTDLPDADVNRVKQIFINHGFSGEILLFSLKQPETITAIKDRLEL